MSQMRPRDFSDPNQRYAFTDGPFSSLAELYAKKAKDLAERLEEERQWRKVWGVK